MMLTQRMTLARFLVEDDGHGAGLDSDLAELIVDISLACRAISTRVAGGALGDVLGSLDNVNPQGERQAKLDVVADNIFRLATEGGGQLSGMASEECESVILPPTDVPRGPYLLAFDPLDGSSNIDVNVAVGSIFSVLRAPAPSRAATVEDFLQPGTEQVAAGYAIYGPTTMFVICLGDGVHGFTFDPRLNELFLTHPDMQIPRETTEFAVNASNARFWEPPVTRYIEECVAGRTGPRGKDFNMRWVASLVAETHRILTRGGVFLYPRDTKDPAKAGRLRLLYEANPIAFLVEQAGGAASTGRQRILEVQPTDLHQRIAFIFGSREEVKRISGYHDEPELETRAG